MNYKTTIYSVMLILALLFNASRLVHAQEARSPEPFTEQSVVLPSSAPQRERLVWLSGLTIARKAEVIAAMGLYDDPQTARPVDYVELYDGSGSLLGVSWVDRYGILRIAVDRALLEGEPASLDGVLVLLADGDHV